MLIPGDRNTPDPGILSLEEMTLNIGIDNGTARVSIREIFANHTNRNLEGTYTFALPIRSLLSDFAVWDDLTRIPGVILERKRADEIYDNLRAKTIDPGLLQMGERSADEASRSSEFTAKVTPIPSRGTKRVEIEYNERIPVEQLSSVLSVPLKPDTYQAQIAGQLDININVVSDRPVKTFEALAKAYPLKISEQSPNRIRASFSGTKVALTEDFSVKYSFDPATADSLRAVDLPQSRGNAGDRVLPGFRPVRSGKHYIRGRCGERASTNRHSGFRLIAVDAVEQTRQQLSGVRDVASFAAAPGSI